MGWEATIAIRTMVACSRIARVEMETADIFGYVLMVQSIGLLVLAWM